MKLAVELAPRHPRGLRLKNPVMAAAGTFGYGIEYAELLDIQRLGAIVSKGITFHPRRGNPQLRTCETPAGMLNAIGLQNIGLRAVIREMAPLWATWQVPVLVNLAGASVEEYAQMAHLLDSVPGVAGLELNISCPNVAGGLDFGMQPELAAQVAVGVRAATRLPFLVKLTPHAPDIKAVAQAVEQAGADAVSLVNTFLGMAIDIRAQRPRLGNVTGGLSGPAIRPLALRLVYEVAQVVRIPVVGVGGIATAEDALEFLMAGATAIQVGTATFVNPRACLEIVEGLEGFMQEEGLEDISRIIGAALPGRRRAQAVAAPPS